MDFGLYLVYTQRLTINGYRQTRNQQLPSILQEMHDRNNYDIYPRHLDQEDLQLTRPLPFGDALKKVPDALTDIFRRFCKDPAGTHYTAERGDAILAELLDEWHDWHLRALEPICVYSLYTKIGGEMEKRQKGEKVVARFVAAA